MTEQELERRLSILTPKAREATERFLTSCVKEGYTPKEIKVPRGHRRDRTVEEVQAFAKKLQK